MPTPILRLPKELVIFTMPLETSFAGRVEKGAASFFKYRISDNRLGRVFAIDPLAAKYPHNSVYAFSENKKVVMCKKFVKESFCQYLAKN
jgi:hypothetical protein